MSTFQILLCTTQEPMVVESGEETLSTGTTWAFSAETGIVICGTVVSPTSGIANFTAMTEYDGCVECLDNVIPIFSANTEDPLCVNCGGSIVNYDQEHPVWTNQYGQPVIQMNAIELGGKNGFYS